MLYTLENIHTYIYTYKYLILIFRSRTLQGIGIDDTFVMLAGWRRTPAKMPVAERMGHMMSEAAVSITITSLTDLFSFWIGIISPFRSVQIFCTYSVFAVVFTFVWHITFFAACMAISGYRERHNLHAIFGCKVQAMSVAIKGESIFLLWIIKTLHALLVTIVPTVVNCFCCCQLPYTCKRYLQFDGDGGGLQLSQIALRVYKNNCCCIQLTSTTNIYFRSLSQRRQQLSFQDMFSPFSWFIKLSRFGRLSFRLQTSLLFSFTLRTLYYFTLLFFYCFFSYLFFQLFLSLFLLLT